MRRLENLIHHHSVCCSHSSFSNLMIQIDTAVILDYRNFRPSVYVCITFLLDLDFGSD